MSDAVKKLHDYLAASPSMVYPEDVLAYLPAIETDNANLRELVRDMFGAYKGAVEMFPSSYTKNVMEMAVMDISDRMRELGVEPWASS